MTESVECLDAFAERQAMSFAHAFVKTVDLGGSFAGNVAFVRSAMRMRAVRVSSFYYKTISAGCWRHFPCFAPKSQTLKV